MPGGGREILLSGHFSPSVCDYERAESPAPLPTHTPVWSQAPAHGHNHAWRGTEILDKVGLYGGGVH